MSNYFYICEDCGSIVTITDEPIPDDQVWQCDCGSTRTSEFDEQAAAIARSEGIRESKFRDEMARIEALKAKIPRAD